MGSFINVPIKCLSSQEEKEHKPQVAAGSFHPDCSSPGISQKKIFSYKFLYTGYKTVRSSIKPQHFLVSQPFLVCFWVQQASHNAVSPSPELTLASTEDTSKTLCLREAVIQVTVKAPCALRPFIQDHRMEEQQPCVSLDKRAFAGLYLALRASTFGCRWVSARLEQPRGVCIFPVHCWAHAAASSRIAS